MKIFTKTLILILLMVFISCTDKKKEEAENREVLEKVEAVESELDQVSEEIETKSDELEKSLEDLDDI